MQVTLAKKLSAVRAWSGMSQVKLAKKSGVSWQQIAHIEQGYRVQVWFATMAKIAAGLGVSLDIFTDAGFKAWQQGCALHVWGER